MNTLFDISPAFPKGFEYFPEFISEAEEATLVRVSAGSGVEHLNFQGYVANRKVASFGMDYSFTTRKLTRGKAIPAEFEWLMQKVADKLSISPKAFEELLVTEYPPGSVINWHRDAPPFDIIAGISLLNDCTFRLRPQEKTKQTRSNIISFPVERRSLYIIKDEARTDWQHSILPVKNTRYSITLRTLRIKEF